ncbi:MAG: hypothetical protein HQL54_04460 [Magnetococcales bacterium]|nr:hypothetical protein [Magnetococcales bacterium]
MASLPLDTYSLIDLLDQTFPHQCILPGETELSAHRRAGARELIDTLMELKQEEQENNPLENH